MQQKKSFNEATIDGQYKNSINNIFNIHNSTIFELIDGYIIMSHNLLRGKYYHLLKSYCEEYVMSNSDHRKYMYRPKYLSNDLYSTPDLWWALLIVNNMSSVMDFKKKTIKIISPGALEDIKTIMLYEEANIIQNKIDIARELESEK